jgi:8-oxo-dGTP pyrophosphatase MutT (NUDIX family)
MRLQQIISKIKQIQPDNLPGFAAQAKMSPPLRGKYSLNDLEKLNAKESAVLILLYEKNEEAYIVFTQRHDYDGAHSGQISLPGGKKDLTDTDLSFTSLRETHEEIGVLLETSAIISHLSWLYVPPSNFVIYPFIAFSETSLSFTPEEKEVKEIIEIPVAQLVNKENQKSYLYENKKFKVSAESPSFQVDGKIIWGATAMILSELLTILEA